MSKNLINLRKSSSKRSLRYGISLAEVSICTVLVGMLLVTSLQTTLFVTRHRELENDQMRASLLADQLLEEVMCLPVDDPDTDETAGTNRSTFDNVGDYYNWISTPPQTKDGTVIPGLANWKRGIRITSIDPSNLTVASDSELHRITVVVARPDGSVTTAIGLVTGDPRPRDPLPASRDVARSITLTLERNGSTDTLITGGLPAEAHAEAGVSP